MKSHKLKEEIVTTINRSELPIDSVYFVLREILNKVSEIYNQELQAIQEEQKEMVKQKEIKENKEESENNGIYKN